ncbi:protein MtfA [Nitrosomonas stercoris]|uniref:Protein MtfA n=1 Tax=Nitrosomonas stercoris TaxID=1444684 RepID=A0A4Y1YIJ8_9PROT|nr:protein MtfA [Nitrosomonas stercoris]
MVGFLEKWRRRRILKRKLIATASWKSIIARLPFLQKLNTSELQRLREWATIFLHDKKIHGVQDLVMTETMQVLIAVQACLPILYLDPSYYDDWIEIIVYPGQFILQRTYRDEAGVVHSGQIVAAGEAWSAGPIILSWEDIAHAHYAAGYNVVIHECAHKLDMLNGSANGYPPLHRSMKPHIWAEIFSQAYATFCEQVEQGIAIGINPYAATHPAEFFAVFSEVFFMQPQLLTQHFPKVYAQLALYYRQDPAARCIL